VTRTVVDALAAAGRTARGIRAIEHDGTHERLAYAALVDDALAIGGALLAAGFEAGNRIAIVVPEVAGFVRAFFGVSAAGMIPVPLCPPAQAGDIATFTRQSAHILRASRAHAVVTTAPVAGLLPGTTPLLILDDLYSGPPMAQPARVRADAPALIQFTSGSTEAPKGVVVSHTNVNANISGISGPSGLAMTTSDVGVSWLPLYHDMGLIGMLLTAVYFGVDTVIMSPVLFLKRPTAWLEAISNYGGTISFAPSFAYDLCLKRVKDSQIDQLDLSSWRVAGCGAEPVRSDTLRGFAEKFARAGFRASSFVPSYGLAESTLAVTLGRGGLRVDTIDGHRLVRHSVAVPAAGSDALVRVVNCGRAFPGHAIRIVSETGQTLSERQVGSILVSGPSVMRGYFENAAATADTIVNGWLETGDVGYLAGGDLHVCGRTKDLIVRGGRKYHPADLESSIADLPGLRASAIVVFGINRPEEPDQVVAVVEARASTAGDTIVDGVRRRVRETAGLDLDHIVVAPPGTIPRTTSGKVRRAETRSRYQTGTLVATRALVRERV